MSGPNEKLGHVLCVDDEPGVLRSLEWLLEEQFEVKVASNGRQALEMLQHHDFDVIISDQRMPGMMGSQFLREARKVSPRSMRILLTGYSDLQAILRSVNDGEVFRFVNKPWNIRELPKIISDAAGIAKSLPAEAAAPETSDEDQLDTGDESILLIDDDRQMEQQILEAVGAEVNTVHASTLAEAVRAAKEHNIGIILADSRVANVDTTTMLKALKKERPDIVTIVYSASTDALDVISLINQGQIFRFIPKPVKPVMLKQALMRAAIKRRELRGSPNAAKRYTVESVTQEATEELLKSIQRSTTGAASAVDVNLLQRMRNTFKRMLGRA